MGDLSRPAVRGRARRWAETIGWSIAPADVRTSLLLAGVAIALWLPGLGWGLPEGIGPAWTDGWSPDEIAPLGFAEPYRALFGDAPRFRLQYPLLHFWFQALFCAPVVLATWLAGGLEGLSDTWPYGLTDPRGALRALTVAGRVPSLLMGAGTVVAAYQIGRETWSRRAGTLGAAGVALAAPVVFYARTSNVDVPALLWTALGISVLAAAARRGLSVRRAAAFGLFAALAGGTKDAAVAPFLGMAVALPFLPAEPGGPVSLRPPPGRARALTIGLVTALLAYAVAGGLAVHPGRWWAHLHFIAHGPLDGYWAGAPTPEEFAATLVRAADQWVGTVGWPLAALGAAGIVLAIRRRPRDLILLLPALGAIGLSVTWRFVFPRFFLVPAFAIAGFAGFAVDRLLRGGVAARRAGTAAAILALGWSGIRSAEMTLAQLRETRDEAAAWLEATAAPGDCVAHTWWISKLPRLPDGVRTLELPWRSDPVPAMAAARPRFLVEVAASPGEDPYEYLVTPELRRWLTDGGGGYRLAFERDYPGRWAGRRVSWVSPPVRIWVREGAAGDGSACADPREVTLPG